MREILFGLRYVYSVWHAVRFLHLWAARFSRHSVSRHRIENDVFGNTLGTG